MPTKDGFTPDYPLPLFLSEHAEELEQPGIGKAWDRAVISSRILKTGTLIVTATAIAILLMGNPVAFFANGAASLVDISAFQPRTDQSTPTIQSNADAQASPPTASDAPPVNPESASTLDDKTALRPPTSGSPTATDAPTRNEIAAETADQSQAEIREQSAEALFKQYQAWASEEHARAQVVQPVQDAPVKVVQDARPQVRPMQKRQHVRPVQNTRAEIGPEQHPRARVRREQNARMQVPPVQVQVPPVQDARAQNQSVQNAQAPSFLQSLGLRN